MTPSPATALLYLLSMVAVAQSGDEPDAGSYRTRTDGPHGSDPRGQLFSPSPLPGQCRRGTDGQALGRASRGAAGPRPRHPRAGAAGQSSRADCRPQRPFQPGPRSTRPGFAPVCSPRSTTSVPLTSTVSTPVA